MKTLKTFVTYLSIHFGEDKAKFILFASKRRAKNIRLKILNIKYKIIHIKQHSEIKYPRWILDETIPGEPMALRNFRLIN